MKPLFEVSATVRTSADRVRALFDGGWVLRAVLGQQERSGHGSPNLQTGIDELARRLDEHASTAG